jgi:hypothetical protein
MSRSLRRVLAEKCVFNNLIIHCRRQRLFAFVENAVCPCRRLILTGFLLAATCLNNTDAAEPIARWKSSPRSGADPARAIPHSPETNSTAEKSAGRSVWRQIKQASWRPDDESHGHVDPPLPKEDLSRPTEVDPPHRDSTPAANPEPAKKVPQPEPRAAEARGSLTIIREYIPGASLPSSGSGSTTGSEHTDPAAHDYSAGTPGAAKGRPEVSLQNSLTIDGPIDRMGLADNLYQIGELVLALEMYEQIDATELPPEERHWINYQAACCLRKLGRIPEARARYREIAESSDAGWLHQLSLWWLDRITERIALEADLEQLQRIVQELKEQHHAGTNH